MAHFEDLAECTYFGSRLLAPGKHLLAVGWLALEKPFASGPVDLAAVSRLIAFSRLSWQPGRFSGFHICELCTTNPPDNVDNLFIPGAGCVYVTPRMITHYILDHGYQPPAEFIAAVLQCPAMNSRAYFDAIIANWYGAVVDHHEQGARLVCQHHRIPKSWHGCIECPPRSSMDHFARRFEVEQPPSGDYRPLPPWLVVVSLVFLSLRLATCH